MGTNARGTAWVVGALALAALAPETTAAREGAPVAPPDLAVAPGLAGAARPSPARAADGAAAPKPVTVRVRVDAEDQASLPVQVFVDADGGPFRATTGGRFPVLVSKGTMHSWTAYALGTERYESASDSRAFETDADLDLVLRLGRAELFAHVVDESHRPLAGVRVLVVPRDAKGLEQKDLDRERPGWIAEWARTTGPDGLASWGRVREGADIRVLSVPNGPSGGASRFRTARVGESTVGAHDDGFPRRTIEMQVLRGNATFRLRTPEVEAGAFRIERRADDGSWVIGWPAGANVALTSVLGAPPSPGWVGTNFPTGTYRLTYAVSESLVYEAILDLADGDDRTVETPKPLALATVEGTIDGPARGVVKTLLFRSRQMADGADPRFLEFNLNLRVDAQGRFVAPVLPGVVRVSFQDPEATRHVDVAVGPRSFAWPPAGPIQIGSARPGSLKIRVLAHGGAPPPVACVRVDRMLGDPAIGAREQVEPPIQCDAKGNVAVGPDLPGVWRVFAWSGTEEEGSTWQDVRVESGRTTEVEIRLP